MPPLPVDSTNQIPRQIIGRDLVARIFRGLNTGRVSQLWINLKNKSAGDGCRDKTIEKTILRTFRARTFSRSLDQKRSYRQARVMSAFPKADIDSSACDVR